MFELKNSTGSGNSQFALLFHQVVAEVDDGEGVVSVAVSPGETLCDGKFHLVKG